MRFACKSCETSIEVTTARIINLPEKCPNCGMSWMNAARGEMPGNPLHAALSQLMNRLHESKGLLNNTIAAPNFGLSLEIEEGTSSNSL